MRKRLNNWLAVVLLLGFVNAALAGTAQAQGAEREFHQTFELNPDGTVSVTNISGSIRVTSWNENRVQVDAVKRARREEDWPLVEIRVTSLPDRLEITTVYPRGRSNSTSVNYDLKVPRSAVLNSINSTSGDISITGPLARVVARSTSGNVSVTDVSGETNLSSTSGNTSAVHIGGSLAIMSTSGNVTVSDVAARINARSTSGNVQISQARDDATAICTSGSIKMERIGGRAIANAHSGSINITGVSGDVEAHATSDNVTIEDVRGRVIASSISGNVSVRKADEGVRANSTNANIEIVAAKGRVEAETVSGSITLREVDSRDLRLISLSSIVQYQGKLYADGRYEFKSFSGNVIVALPADSEFNLTAQSFSGSVNTEFPLQITSGKLSARGPIQGVVGKGGAQVKAESFSGSVHIKKLLAQAR